MAFTSFLKNIFFLLRYSWFTVFQVHSKLIQLYVYNPLFFFKIFSIIAAYKILNIVPCVYNRFYSSVWTSQCVVLIPHFEFISPTPAAGVPWGRRKAIVPINSVREFPPRSSGFRIWLQRPRWLWRCGFAPRPQGSVLKEQALLYLWHRSQLRLGFSPGPGTSTCHGCGQKKN